MGAEDGRTSRGAGSARATAVRLAAIGLGGALLVAVALHATAPISCTDFFWHLKLGQRIAATGSIPRTDTFSAVWPDAPYVQPQWLWEWFAAQLYALGGWPAIRGAQGGLLVGSFAALLGIARRICGSSGAACLVGALAFTLFEDRFRARPDATTLGFVALSLPILFNAAPRVTVRLGGYLAGLSVLWANLHGGASLLLLLSLGALAVGAMLEARLGLAGEGGVGRGRAALTLLGIGAAGLVLSPTLVQGVSDWARLIGTQIATGNEEWLPTYTVLRQAITPCTLLIAAAPSLMTVAYAWHEATAVRRSGVGPGRLGEWLLCGGYLVLSHHAIRNAVLCVVPLIFMLRRSTGSQGGSKQLSSGKLLAAAALVFGVTLTDVVERSYGGLRNARELFSYDLAPEAYPERAGDFMARAGIEGGVFNDGKWGGYLVFRAFPRIRVVADSRQNFSPELWRIYLATLSLKTREAALREAFRRWGVELVLLRGPTFALGKAPAGYQLLYKAGDEELYQHLAGRHAVENLRRARAFLSANGARADEDLTSAAVRVGARRFLDSPFQGRSLRRLRAQATSSDAAEAADAHVRLAETYYRAGLYPQALAEFETARRLGPLGTRAVYVEAFCAYAAADFKRARAGLGELRTRDLAALSPRQRERLVFLATATEVR